MFRRVFIITRGKHIPNTQHDILPPLEKKHSHFCKCFSSKPLYQNLRILLFPLPERKE